MKIENKCVKIKIGKKEKTFTNLILNNYIDLYADSFLSFKTKWLPYCFIKFDSIQAINENSTTMDYDIILEAQYKDMQQIFTQKNVTNKYIYYNEAFMQNLLKNYKGEKITRVGLRNV